MTFSGGLLIILWAMWKLMQFIDMPNPIKIGLILVFGGMIIAIASLVYERSQDVKKESFSK